MELKDLQREYAKLVVNEGLAIHEGQRLVINCPVDSAFFARMCADAAYDAGCKEVILRWRDDYLTRAKYLRADDSIFDSVDAWDVTFYDTVAEEGAGWLSISSTDPGNLKDVDPARIKRANLASGKAMAKFRKLEMSNGFPWCVCAIPSPAWAKMVFPGLCEEEAVMKLWEEILKACRCDEEGAVERWRSHSKELRDHVEKLTAYAFRSLHYKNSLGTDVVVELPEGHFWAGGAEVDGNGVSFSPNIPTEEVFTLPRKTGVNGRLVASRPLCLNGNVIENFGFEVRDGKITEVFAEKGLDILKDAVSVDEGASYFGEAALVPFHSPISSSGILFYNTLFDENASCHFAFGSAYPCIEGADDMSEEELEAAGVNMSMTHVDFMIGTSDLSIKGTTRDGEEIPVFVNGDFAF